MNSSKKDLTPIIAIGEKLLADCRAVGTLRISKLSGRKEDLSADGLEQLKKSDDNFNLLKSKKQHIEQVVAQLNGVLAKLDPKNSYITSETKLISYDGEVTLPKAELDNKIQQVETLVFYLTGIVFAIEQRELLAIEESIRNIFTVGIENSDLSRFQSVLDKSKTFYTNILAIQKKYSSLTIYSTNARREWFSMTEQHYQDHLFSKLEIRADEAITLGLNAISQQIGYHFFESFLAPNKEQIHFSKSCVKFISETLEDDHWLKFITSKNSSILIDRAGVLGMLHMLTHSILKNTSKKDKDAVQKWESKITKIQSLTKQYEQNNKNSLCSLTGYQLFLGWFLDYLMSAHKQIRLGEITEINKERFYVILHDTAQKVAHVTSVKPDFQKYIGPSYITYCAERIAYHSAQLPEINDQALELGLKALNFCTAQISRTLISQHTLGLPLQNEAVIVRLMQMYQYFYIHHPYLKQDVSSICTALNRFKNKEEITGISTDLARSLVRYHTISPFFEELSESFERHFHSHFHNIGVINIFSHGDTAEVLARELDKNLSSTVMNVTDFMVLRSEVRKTQAEYMDSEKTIREHLKSFEKHYKKQIALAKKEAGIHL